LSVSFVGLVGCVLTGNHGTYYYNNRSIDYCEENEYDSAIQSYNKAIELDPEHNYTYNSRGISYNEKEEYGKAIQDHNEVIECVF
jgi:tetratricopeptide (TPR) repeat protein